MKKLLLISIVTALAASAYAQTVTNITITAVIKLDNGTAFTNKVSNSNAKIIIASTNAMVRFNRFLAGQSPPKPATTNISDFFVEFTKVQFLRYKDEWDSTIMQDLQTKFPNLSESKKDEIRTVVNAP